MENPTAKIEGQMIDMYLISISDTDSLANSGIFKNFGEPRGQKQVLKSYSSQGI